MQTALEAFDLTVTFLNLSDYILGHLAQSNCRPTLAKVVWLDGLRLEETIFVLPVKKGRVNSAILKVADLFIHSFQRLLSNSSISFFTDNHIVIGIVSKVLNVQALSLIYGIVFYFCSYSV